MYEWARHPVPRDEDVGSSPLMHGLERCFCVQEQHDRGPPGWDDI